MVFNFGFISPLSTLYKLKIDNQNRITLTDPLTIADLSLNLIK